MQLEDTTQGGLGTPEETHPDSSSYDALRALQYAAHHRKNPRARLTTWREGALLRRSLASLPPLGSILDAPCGGGRFFSVLAEVRGADLVGADVSEAMLAIAARQSEVTSGRVRLLRCSLFQMRCEGASVDCVVCMRFFHHFALVGERTAALREIHRVTRRFAIVSLWVDGNLQSLRRSEPRPTTPGYGRRGWVNREAFVNEVGKCGFRVLRHFDVAKGLSMWRLYVLEKAAHPERNLLEARPAEPRP